MTRFTGFLLAILLFAGTLSAQQFIRGNVHIGFLYPLSSNWIQASDYSNAFSLHALGGVSGGERAFCASGVTNVVRGSATGLIAAGFSNHILDRAEGVQAAGFMNTISLEAAGFTAAGFMNLAGSGKGMQAAGFANINLRQMNGVQAAGFINTATEVHSQLAGFINLGRNVRGTQFAGFINIAKEVHGTQIAGFINIADSNDYPIGIINIIRKGEKGLGITVDETSTTLLSFRSGGRVLYGILGVGANFRERKPFYALETGLGAALHISPHFRVRAEGSAIWLTKFASGNYLRSTLRVLPAVKLGDQVELFAGPTINQLTIWENTGVDLAPHYLWQTRRCGTFYGIYMGGIAGLQIHF
jgi:hypothetical protein